MAILTPQAEINITGVDLTGADLATNRKYTISDSSIASTGMRIHSGSSFLHEGLGNDWTFDGIDTITFLVNMPNTAPIAIFYYTSSTPGSGSSLSYSSVINFIKHIQSLKTIPDKDSFADNAKEEVGTGDNSKLIFYLDNIGILDGTYNIYYGSSVSSLTEFTEGTHYSIDLDVSKITLTAAGRTALSTNKIFADYWYNMHELLNSEMTRALAAAENKVFRRTEQAFANFTDDDPNYIKVVNEVYEGGLTAQRKAFDFWYQPLVKLATTINGDYTTGGTSIILSNAGGFPNAGTIYIGGNKVAYTAKSSNTLTIPSTTPSIADAAVVRGEVVELSKEAEGNDPSYSILDPNTEYKIDYDAGRVMPIENAFFGELSNSDVIFPANYLIRTSYFTAWHESGKNPTVPEAIEEVVYMIAAKKFTQRIVKKSHIQGTNDFVPTAINSGDDEINEVLNYYQSLNVGTSPFNRQAIG